MKDDLIYESRSEGAKIAYDLGVLVKQKKDKTVLAVNDVREWIAAKRKLDRNDPKMESPDIAKGVASLWPLRAAPP